MAGVADVAGGRVAGVLAEVAMVPRCEGGDKWCYGLEQEVEDTWEVRHAVGGGDGRNRCGMQVVRALSYTHRNASLPKQEAHSGHSSPGHS